MTRCVLPSRPAVLSKHHLARSVGLYALVGQCWAGDVAAQLFQRPAVIGAAAHGCVQTEPVDVGTQGLLEVRIPGHDTLASPSQAPEPERSGIVLDSIRQNRAGLD